MIVEKAIELLQKTNEDRIKYINKRIFIDYNYIITIIIHPLAPY
jgi:hypothetical protein